LVSKRNQQEDSDERIAGFDNYMTSAEKQWHARVSKMALTTVAMWAENHDCQIALADIPSAL
jgi:hypothetical protein